MYLHPDCLELHPDSLPKGERACGNFHFCAEEAFQFLLKKGHIALFG